MNSIKDLFSELKYYESQGYYKLADQIQEKIYKIAYRDLANTPYDKAMIQKFNVQQMFRLILTIPECQSLKMKDSKMPMTAPSFMDYVAKNSNTNTPIEDLKEKYVQTYGLMSPNMQGSYDKCLDAIALRLSGSYQPNNPKQQQTHKKI